MRGISSRALATTWPCVAPTTAPTEASGPRRRPSRSTSAATRSHSWPPPASSSSCSAALPGFDVRTSTKSPRPLRAARLDERLEPVVSEVRVDRQRVAAWARALDRRREVGRRVGGRGRADVAPLAVEHDEQAGGARGLADALERRERGRADRLEERELRLDRDRVLGDGLDDPAAEALDRPRRTRRAGAHAVPDRVRQALEIGIEADAHDALSRARRRVEARAERG